MFKLQQQIPIVYTLLIRSTLPIRVYSFIMILLCQTQVGPKTERMFTIENNYVI